MSSVPPDGVSRRYHAPMSDGADCPCSLHECCFCFHGYSPANTYVLLSPTTTAHLGCLDRWREFYPPHAAALKVVRDEIDSLRNFGPNRGGDPGA